MTCVYLWLCLG